MSQFSTAHIDYLNFIIEMADLAILNQDNPQITPETVEKAYKTKEKALRELEGEKKRQHERSARDDRSL